MRSWTSFVSLFGALSLLVACSSDDSLGVKTDHQTGSGGSGGESKCDGPDPSTLSCANGCPSGTVCDAEACFPSLCSCDEKSGAWQCTADCGLGACVPAPSACDGPDPSTLSCANGCPSGTVCDPEACFPSSCSCDEKSGAWGCTADCGLGACVPAPTCKGPDPSQGCEGGCPDGTQCDTTACRPSGCSCDGATGSWQCTADCGEGGACVAP